METFSWYFIASSSVELMCSEIFSIKFNGKSPACVILCRDKRKLSKHTGNVGKLFKYSKKNFYTFPVGPKAAVSWSSMVKDVERFAYKIKRLSRAFARHDNGGVDKFCYSSTILLKQTILWISNFIVFYLKEF